MRSATVIPFVPRPPKAYPPAGAPVSLAEVLADPTALTRPCPGPGAPGCNPATCPAATVLCSLSEAI